MAHDGPSIIALIPARSGSKRVPEKNIRPLGPHPLLAYTIAAARGPSVRNTFVEPLLPLPYVRISTPRSSRPTRTPVGADPSK